ncbi:hypothetical protein B1B04_12195 [Lysinibacillus sp. KCTC 33748]|uniref:hypothetical protein n=1 Tax=unclassified Lysinibacillus TaxID=2636778 RepID=UPI0009A85834|nr:MULTISPECIES: hypothetical protein [unclassified Lysinibacillus]OXS73479.1 hypothetical protein B1B04_12195 [Lysinibacillus sp. KCTC 33748]SKB78535.1 hypothetical protein SAMN06295926_10838 [Lysinibacillus sp. AC-3]
MIAWIITAEISFWIVIIIGLICRYVFNMPKLSIFFFALTPVIDLFLVILTAMDLKAGTPASTSHGIAAIYIGVSIAFSKTMITWADEKFQKWFLKSNQKNEPLTGVKKGKHEIKMLSQHIGAFIIGAGLLYAMSLFVGSNSDTSPLFQ